jgi:hypothetical protein
MRIESGENERRSRCGVHSEDRHVKGISGGQEMMCGKASAAIFPEQTDFVLYPGSAGL